MKQIILIISSILFSLLFYKQNIGVNLSIFSIITIILLAISNINAFKNRTTQLYAFVYLVTAVLVFFQHTQLAIIVNCIAFFSVIGIVTEAKSSIFVVWLNGFYTSIGGFFHRKANSNKEEKLKESKDIDIMHWIKLIGIPLVFIIVFILLYRNGNSVFNELISKINFEFINIQWLMFSFFGYYLFSNIINPVQIEATTQIDLNTSNTLTKTENYSAEALKKEKQLGTTLMLLLNLLIIFYVVTDIVALNTTQDYNATSLSNNVHNGINALIASIVIAIAIILYFFRGNLNFYKDNNTLKNLSYVWIILNAVLVILISIKNYQYVNAFGFTYKRIGVYMYLLLTFIGLATTLIKVLKIKNLLFLFRVNTQIAFALLLVSSLINWDYQITKYNINNAQSLDIEYLINLSDNNTELLNTYSKTNALDTNKQVEIKRKHQSYIEVLKQRNWQEYTFENYKVNTNETPNN